MTCNNFIRQIILYLRRNQFSRGIYLKKYFFRMTLKLDKMFKGNKHKEMIEIIKNYMRYKIYNIYTHLQFRCGIFKYLCVKTIKDWKHATRKSWWHIFNVHLWNETCHVRFCIKLKTQTFWRNNDIVLE